MGVYEKNHSEDEVQNVAFGNLLLDVNIKDQIMLDDVHRDVVWEKHCGYEIVPLRC